MRLPEVTASKRPTAVTVPQLAVACANVMIELVIACAGTVAGSDPLEAEAGVNALNLITSVPTPDTELLHVTPFAGVPIIVTVVDDGTLPGVVISRTDIPTVTHEGSEENVIVEPVAETAVTLPDA